MFIRNINVSRNFYHLLYLKLIYKYIYIFLFVFNLHVVELQVLLKRNNKKEISIREWRTIATARIPKMEPRRFITFE